MRRTDRQMDMLPVAMLCSRIAEPNLIKYNKKCIYTVHLPQELGKLLRIWFGIIQSGSWCMCNRLTSYYLYLEFSFTILTFIYLEPLSIIHNTHQSRLGPGLTNYWFDRSNCKCRCSIRHYTIQMLLSPFIPNHSTSLSVLHHLLYDNNYMLITC